MLGEKSPRVRVSTVHVQELLGVFLPRLKRVHFTNSDLNIKILPIQRLILSLKNVIFPGILQIFGIELVSLEDKQKGTYILVNTLDTDVDEQLESDPNLTLTPVDWSDENHAKTGLLMVVLSAIFMNGEVMVDCKYLFKTHCYQVNRCATVSQYWHTRSL